MSKSIGNYTSANRLSNLNTMKLLGILIVHVCYFNLNHHYALRFNSDDFDSNMVYFSIIESDK